MGAISFIPLILLATLFLHLSFQQDHQVEAQKGPRGPFINNRLRTAFILIQRFKRRIQSDPKNITGSWMGPNVCRYRGIICSVAPDLNLLTVAGIDFNGAKFAGFNNRLPLNGFLDKLEDLVFFHANSNNFTGTVPRGTSRLRYFYELDLSNNKLSGGYPTETIRATNLTFLDLRYNFFNSTVPTQTFNLDVSVLFLNNNNFQQRIPLSLGSTPARYLTLANNKFIGTIPRSIRRARKTLHEVLFLGNTLSGCLPYEIGYLNRATVFDVSGNRLTGPIPSSFACLARAQYLSLAQNQFYGRVPDRVCNLTRLNRFSLANNYFTRVGPACRNLIRRRILDVRGNCIAGLPNQKTAAQCAAFFSRPRTCPRQNTMSLIPCTIGRSSALNQTNSLLTEEEHIQAPAPAPRTYASLAPHLH